MGGLGDSFQLVGWAVMRRRGKTRIAGLENSWAGLVG